MTYLWLFIFEEWFASVPDPDPWDPYLCFGPPWYASGSASQRHGSEDPEPHPDPYQNVTDPQHWLEVSIRHTSAERRIELTCMVVVSSSLACPMMLCFTGRFVCESARYSRKSGKPDTNKKTLFFTVIQFCGSGSFYHQAKIVRKTSIPTVFWLLYNYLSLKNDENVASKSIEQKNLK